MSNNRASLLAGLRTGGVRATTNPLPHTAAPTVTSFPRSELPMSASFNNSFSQQMHSAQVQQVQQLQAQQQALQMQMMQMEIMRLQALQQAQQQLQAELVRQQQQQQQVVAKRRSLYNEPMSAAPAQTSFMNHRSSQAEQAWQQTMFDPRDGSDDQVPMTASLGGKFGSRLNPNAAAFRMSSFPEEEEMTIAALGAPASGNAGMGYSQPSGHQTTVLSGGIPLGLPNAATTNQGTSGMTASKSDTSLNWRSSANNSVLKGANRAASVSVKITPPPEERVSPPLMKNRPEPLRFSIIPEKTVTPLVIVDSSDGEADGDDSSSSGKSEPTTPPSVSSVPLSPREVASKRLYEGLGIGRPVPHTAAVHTLTFLPSSGIPVPNTSTATSFPNKATSTAVRQPRGPPAGVDELGPKNFASRIRRKAIGGLGAMLDARVNRQEIEAF